MIIGLNCYVLSYVARVLGFGDGDVDLLMIAAS
jgi:hypothetical protein